MRRLRCLLLLGLAAAGPGRALDDAVVRATDEGTEKLYELKFDEAFATFGRLRDEHPDHPAGYALLGAARWWQARYQFTKPDDATTREVQRDVAEAIRLSRSLAGKPGFECEGKFFLGGALGLQAHWELLRGHWLRAALQARDAVHVLQPLMSCTVYADDVCLGLGLYEYVAASLPLSFRWLSKYVVGAGTSKTDALAKLERAAASGRFMRNDAQATLVTLQTVFDRRPAAAVAQAEALLRERPRSPLAHTLWAQALVFAGRWQEALAATHRALVMGEAAGSTFAFEIPAYRYFEGLAHLGANRPEEAERSFTAALAAPGRPSWLAAAQLKRGCVRDLLGRRAEAVADYRAVLARPDPWHQGNRAKLYLKKPFTWKDFDAEISPRAAP